MHADKIHVEEETSSVSEKRVNTRGACAREEPTIATTKWQAGSNSAQQMGLHGGQLSVKRAQDKIKTSTQEKKAPVHAAESKIKKRKPRNNPARQREDIERPRQTAELINNA